MPGRHSKSSFCDDCCPKVCLSTVFLEVLKGHEIMLITWLLIQCLGKTTLFCQKAGATKITTC